MTFMVKISRPPFEVSFEAGSIGEANNILSEQDSELSRLFNGVDAVEQGAPAGEAKPARKPRSKNQPDPAKASAPPPAAIPGAAFTVPVSLPAAPTPVAVAPADGLEIPTFLQRAAAPVAPAPSAPPPPPLPAAPPIAPASANRLAGLVIADLKKRAAGQPDGGQALSDWLASAGIVTKGAKFDEALAVVQFQKDEQLAGVAAQLGVA